MIRTEQFLISRPMYAVDLGGMIISTDGGADAAVPAVWFRRKKGVTAACAGFLRDYQVTAPDGALSFLAAYDDGRRGGDCKARWDGTTFWFAPPMPPEETGRYAELLRPMLAAYPQVPDGFDGWWWFGG